MKLDLREYARQTTFRLIAGGIFLLVVVGIGLIYLIFGPSAALGGLLCIGVGLFPILLIILVLALIDAVVKRVDRER
jgi:hypothetical protein